MPRRKKVVEQELSTEEKLVARQKDRESILADTSMIEAQIVEQKKLLKAKKKELRAADKDIAALQAQKEQEEEAKSTLEKNEAMAKAIEELLKKGKTVEDILGAFPD